MSKQEVIEAETALCNMKLVLFISIPLTQLVGRRDKVG